MKQEILRLQLGRAPRRTHRDARKLALEGQETEAVEQRPRFRRQLFAESIATVAEQDNVSAELS
jgi:hypothetical protein